MLLLMGIQLGQDYHNDLHRSTHKPDAELMDEERFEEYHVRVIVGRSLWASGVVH